MVTGGQRSPRPHPTNNTHMPLPTEGPHQPRDNHGGPAQPRRPPPRRRRRPVRTVQPEHPTAARAESGLPIFTPDQALELASAACRAAEVRAGDPRVAAELASWTGPAAPTGAGLPTGVLPDHPAQTTVPGRDFGRAGTLPIGTGHDKAAVYALLFGEADEPVNWLRTGEALSAAWLTATTLGVSVVPLSDVVEVVHTGQTLRHL